MVLVDARHEDTDDRQPQSFVESALAAQDQQDFMCRTFAPIGIVRAFDFATIGGLPEVVQPLSDAVRSRTQFCITLKNENAATDANEAQVRKSGSLGALPLIVIMRGEGIEPNPSMGLTRELASEIGVVWEELQHELSELSSNSTFIVAERSGHDVS